MCRSRCPSYLCHLLVAASLGACSGGASLSNEMGSGGGTDPPITGRPDIPITGTANYSGFLTASLPAGGDRSDAVGDLTLEVDFDAAGEQVTGTAQNFIMIGEGALTGRLFVTAGELEIASDTATVSVEAGISGTLQGATYPNTLITGTMGGDFTSSDLNLLSGIVFGDVTTISGVDIFNGSFSVAKQ